MMTEKTFTIQFADIFIRFQFPEMIEIPRELLEFHCEETENPDAEYEIQLLTSPLELSGKFVIEKNGMKIYQCEEGELRVYLPLIEKTGCQVACLIRENQQNTLYYPASKWQFYARELHLLHLIGIEKLLWKKRAFLLHSSLIKINGQAVLFSGPSGVGKSTQAALWKEYLGADILNGDRCIVRQKEDEIYGCGSPWCGTSGIYSREQAPIKGIFLLKQSEENTVRRITTEALSKILQQSIVNAWDREFMADVIEAVVSLLRQIPVYELACRPDQGAVILAYETLFSGGI